MSNSINKDELIKRVAAKTGQDKNTVTEIVDTTFEEIYQAFKREEKVTIRNFGTFYIDVRRSGTVFKFNPASGCERCLVGRQITRESCSMAANIKGG